MNKIFFLFLVVNLLLSCNSSDQLNKSSIDDSFIPASKYGSYHNDLLNFYLNEKNSEQITNIIEVYDELKYKSDILFPKMISENEYLFYRNRMLTIFENNEQKNNFDLIDFEILSINTFLSNEASKQLVTLLKNNENPQKVNQVFTNLLNNNTITEIEKNEILKMKIVYNSSVDFWNAKHYHKNLEKTIQCNPQHQIFLSDAVGTLFGGLGSVGFSWFCYEAQSQNGGGCI